MSPPSARSPVGTSSEASDTIRQTTLQEPGGPLGTGLGPLDIALRRAVGQHEPAGSVGTKAVDDVGGVDGVLLRLRHLLDGADLDRRAGRKQPRLAGADLLDDLDVSRRQPFAGLRLVGLVHHHALREQAAERLVEADMAAFLHRAGEEARIEQVQDGVLDAANILVDRQPGIDDVTARSASGRAAR